MLRARLASLSKTSTTSQMPHTTRLLNTQLISILFLKAAVLPLVLRLQSSILQSLEPMTCSQALLVVPLFRGSEALMLSQDEAASIALESFEDPGFFMRTFLPGWFYLPMPWVH